MRNLIVIFVTAVCFSSFSLEIEMAEKQEFLGKEIFGNCKRYFSSNADYLFMF